MEYTVLVEHLLPDEGGWEIDLEPGTVIQPGDRLVDGDLEPDLMASLWSNGIIEPADMEAEALRLADPESEDAPDEDEQ